MEPRVPIERFEQLEAWKQAHRLVLDICTITRRFPDSEKYGITSQFRRAAVSVPANIVEGFKRRSIAEKARFYNIAQASLEEARYFAILSRDLALPLDHAAVADQIDQVARLLHGLTRSLREPAP